MIDFAINPSSNRVPDDERTALLSAPRFGSVFTDHMVTIRWDSARGWHDARVEALAPFPLHPASAVLHYAQEIFEGMKAYRGADARPTLFRPLDNARRFVASAERMAMPPLPPAIFMEAIERLVAMDADWIPDGDGSLYLRPFMFADDVFLGVRPASRYTFCLIASPSGAYFADGLKPLSVWVSQGHSRAARGGTGAAKCGGNYAGSLIAQAEAAANGCEQVLFLDAASGTLIEELGGMNIFFVMADGTLVTPPLGTILPGITRDSVITLAGDLGHRVAERAYAFDEWQADAVAGRNVEAFVCGTAATIVPVGRVRHAGGSFAIGDGGAGPVTNRLRDTLIAIQRGAAADAHGWRYLLTAGYSA